MTDARPLHEPEHQPATGADRRRWLGAAAVAAVVLVPIGILVFSNLDSTEVSWAGFQFNQPLWLVLFATFVAGMVGGKVGGWLWRRWRKRRRRLKEELEVLRKHNMETDPSDS